MNLFACTYIQVLITNFQKFIFDVFVIGEIIAKKELLFKIDIAIQNESTPALDKIYICPSSIIYNPYNP
jgi:hypothetical protein